jgi:RNA polymerase sigma-70 factor (ECF subfamily)
MESDARTLLNNALARTAAGERTGLQTVYRLTSAKLFGVCLRILNDRAEAEDVLQEVYVTVWRKAAAFDPTKAAAMTWLIAITRNRAIDRLRARGAPGRMAPIDEAAGIADAAPAADTGLENAEANARLRRCLDGLEAQERAAVRGAFFDGNTYEALAERMKVPLGTMKSRIRRAMLKLRACLES